VIAQLEKSALVGNSTTCCHDLDSKSPHWSEI
jgi:hypothetical protein